MLRGSKSKRVVDLLEKVGSDAEITKRVSEQTVCVACE